MAKIAQVTYGTSGEGEQYTYVVNDSVKAGQVINPSVKHHKSQKIFATTAIVQETAKTITKRGRELKDEANEAMEGTDKELVKAVAPSDIGLTRATQTRGAGGRFQGSYSATGGVKIKGSAESGYYGSDPQQFHRNPYIDAQRGANLASRKVASGGDIADTPIQHDAQDTFDSYSARFMTRR